MSMLNILSSIHFRILISSSALQATVTTLLLVAGVAPTVLGFAMTYILQVPGLFAAFVKYRVVLESDLVSLERLQSYERIGHDEESSVADPANIDDDAKAVNPGPNWPAHGEICFHDFSARHGDGLPLCLRNVMLTIKPGEHVGVIGRTGSGKSSLALSLVRIVEAAAGHICIDGVDIARVPLRTLRERIAIIPQECAIFRDTLRYNLDPLGTHSDDELRTVIHDTFLDSMDTHSSVSDALDQELGGTDRYVS